MPTETLYVSTVFFAGILSFLSPCVVPLLPVYLSVLAPSGVTGSAPDDKVRLRLALVLRTLLFIAGIAVCFVLLGFGAGALGGMINSDAFMIAMGILVVVLGIHQTGLIKLK
jgi:cytochrome c-type biogenesis protein